MESLLELLGLRDQSSCVDDKVYGLQVFRYVFAGIFKSNGVKPLVPTLEDAGVPAQLVTRFRLVAAFQWS